MTSLPKALLVLGILLTAGGVAGTGFFYRQMKIENLMHARTGDIPVDLGQAAEWKSAGFNVFREGQHTLILSLANSRRTPARPVRFRGSIEIEVARPDGTPAFRKSVLPKIGAIPRPGAGLVVLVDSFAVADPGEEPWTVRARVAAADTVFANVSAELSVLPPQLYDIGDYLSGRIVTLISMGFMAVAGFAVIVFSAHLQRRSTAARGA